MSNCNPNLILDNTVVNLDSDITVTTTARVENVETTITLPNGVIYADHEVSHGYLDYTDTSSLKWYIPTLSRLQKATLKLSSIVLDEAAFSATDRQVVCEVDPVSGELIIENNTTIKEIVGITCTDIRSCVDEAELLGLTDLTDVTITTPQSQHGLMYNGSEWVNRIINTSDLNNDSGWGDGMFDATNNGGSWTVNSFIITNNTTASFSGNTQEFNFNWNTIGGVSIKPINSNPGLEITDGVTKVTFDINASRLLHDVTANYFIEVANEYGVLSQQLISFVSLNSDINLTANSGEVEVAGALITFNDKLNSYIRFVNYTSTAARAGTPIANLQVDSSGRVLTTELERNGVFDTRNQNGTWAVTDWIIPNTTVESVEGGGTIRNVISADDFSPTIVDAIVVSGGTLSVKTTSPGGTGIWRGNFYGWQTSTQLVGSIKFDTGSNFGASNYHGRYSIDTVEDGGTFISERFAIDGNNVVWPDFTGTAKDETPLRILGVNDTSFTGKMVTVTPAELQTYLSGTGGGGIFDAGNDNGLLAVSTTNIPFGQSWTFQDQITTGNKVLIWPSEARISLIESGTGSNTFFSMENPDGQWSFYIDTTERFNIRYKPTAGTNFAYYAFDALPTASTSFYLFAQPTYSANILLEGDASSIIYLNEADFGTGSSWTIKSTGGNFLFEQDDATNTTGRLKFRNIANQDIFEFDMEDNIFQMVNYGVGTYDGTPTRITGWDGSGNMLEVTPAELSTYLGTSTQNIYTTDGTIGAGRTVTLPSAQLAFATPSDASSRIEIGNVEQNGLTQVGREARLAIKSQAATYGHGLYIEGNNSGSYRANRIVMNNVTLTNSFPNLIQAHQASGSIASPTNLPANIRVLSLSARAYRDADYREIVQVAASTSTNFGASNYHGKLEIKTIASGSTSASNHFVVDGSDIIMGAYGLGSKTGTAAYLLAVDSGGNVIEETLSDYTTTYGTDNQIPYTNATGDGFDYSSGLTFDGSQLRVDVASAAPQLYITTSGASTRIGVNHTANCGFGFYMANVLKYSFAVITGSTNFDAGLYNDQRGEWAYFIDGDTNAIRFDAYGLAAHTGTPAYLLGVDSSGNIIEETLSTYSDNIYTADGTTGDVRTITVGSGAGTKEVNWDAGNTTGALVTSFRSLQSVIREDSHGTSATQGSALEFRRSRGTAPSSPSNASAGDTIGFHTYAAYQDVAYQQVAKVFGYAGSAFGSFNYHGRYVIQTVANGATALADRLTINGNQIQFNDFGLGNFTGTAAYLLAVDSGGNVIEETLTEYANTSVEHTKGIVIESPTSSENITMFFTDVAITISQVNDVVAGTTPSVTWNIDHATTRNSGTPNSLFTSDRTTTSESGAETTTFNDATIPAGSWIWLTTSAQSGTVNEFAVTIEYTVD